MGGGFPADAEFSAIDAGDDDERRDDRRSADAYNSLGWSLYKLGRYDQAIAAYERSIALDPAAARTRNNLELAKRDRDAKRR